MSHKKDIKMNFYINPEEPELLVGKQSFGPGSIGTLTDVTNNDLQLNVDAENKPVEEIQKDAQGYAGDNLRIEISKSNRANYNTKADNTAQDSKDGLEQGKDKCKFNYEKKLKCKLFIAGFAALAGILVLYTRSKD